ncbi:MAG: sugar phosphate isomerase/epimerase [Nanoarchaeota archaeon]
MMEADSGNFYTGHRMGAEDLALTTDGRTANQLQEVSNKLNTGAKVMELSGSDPGLLDSIPKQQFKEINRLSKLTGSEMTMHGPQVEASGYDKQGWSEANRQNVERQMALAVERAHDLNSNGNIPVTFHSTAMLPEMETKVMEKDEHGIRKQVSKEFYLVDPRTGAMLNPLKPTERFFPGDIAEGEKQKPFNPEEELKRINKDQWSQTLGNINFSALRGEETLRGSIEHNRERALSQGVSEEEFDKVQSRFFKEYAESRKNPASFEKLPEEIKKAHEDEFKRFDHASIFLKDAYRGLKEMYNMAYKESSEEDRKKLNAYADSIKEKVNAGIETDPEKMQEFAEVIQNGVKVLNGMTPSIYKPMKEFVMDKSSTTFGNVALSAWKKFGDKSPIVSIENPPAGGGLSTAEDLKELIVKSRGKFVEAAMKEGYGKGEAEQAAEKVIGVTWDVGHINMLKKQGYEDKDIIKQSEIIAPFVKHVHLSDNFGMEHTELPMGMGNVPTKEIMEKLGKEGFSGKKVIEAFQWWQHFKSPPLVPTMEAFGSPLYPMLNQPSWNQMANTYGSYFAFPSAYMPETHFSLYGGGFSNLPQELGGQMPGKQNRLTGTPMD